MPLEARTRALDSFSPQRRMKAGESERLVQPSSAGHIKPGHRDVPFVAAICPSLTGVPLPGHTFPLEPRDSPVGFMTHTQVLERGLAEGVGP